MKPYTYPTDKKAEKRDARISNGGMYRYYLSRIWDKNLRKVAFVCLNPSTADANNDDPTIRRCRRFAKDWGYGGFYMVNLFAFRATDPKRIREVPSPVGHENDKWIAFVVAICDKLIFAWGINGSFMNREKSIMNKYKDYAYYLELSKGGHPKHPLYLKADIKPQKYER